MAPFSAYHHLQTALKMHQWISNESVFCMMCGKMKQNPSTLMKHITSEHRISCGQCRTVLTSRDELALHLSLHDSKTRLSSEEYNLQKDSDQIECLNASGITLQSNHQTKCSYKKRCEQKIQVRNSLYCDKCSLAFPRRYDLKRHKLIYHSVKHSDKENSCDKSVNNVEEEIEISRFDNKSQERLGGETKYDVDDMVLNYSDDSVNSEDIRRHLDTSFSQVKNDVESDKMGFSCSVCEFECSERQEMLNHRRKEHSLKEKKSSSQKSVSKSFLCSFCQNSYSRSSDLQRHILKKHGGEKFMGRCIDSVDDMSVDIINRAKRDINGTIVYQCDVCDKNMLTKRGFVRHVRIHRDERPFTCHVCGRQYRSHPDLTRHLRSVHEKVKNYPCDICSRSFASKGTRDDHRRTHTGERPYVCHTCGKAFPTPNSIYVHRRTHSDYFPHHCSTCSKKFRRKQQLTHHMRTHTGEKPHSCDVCGKRFGVKDEVSRHRQTHSNEKPHVCPVCGICFGQKRYLTNHLKTHHSRAL